MDIILTTLNARYAHTSFGLRYLRANLGDFQEKSLIREYTIKSDLKKCADEICALKPKIIGFGVYIWNTNQTLQLIRWIRQILPDVLIVAGGPEISFETEGQEIYKEVNFVFKGEADFLFRDFVSNYFLYGQLPQTKIIGPQLPAIDQICLPYAEYTDEDVKNRKIYVEVSRGCPYKCEYCLSSLDVSVRNFNVDIFLNEMQILLNRGVRQFKFVDRTFNLSPTISLKILQFFYDRIELGLFLHFEMVPDRLPDDLKLLIQKFPKGSLQFEIGIQTWNPEVAKNVSRRQNYQKIEENLKFLKEHTGVHTHADLIIGLPGETWQSFADGFDKLATLEPDEIQVGILKRLKGAPLRRHEQNFAMVYDKSSPFQILHNRDLNAEQMHQLEIFSDYWDAIANSGRYPNFMGQLRKLAEEKNTSFFDLFFRMALLLYQKFERTHSIHLQAMDKALLEIGAQEHTSVLAEVSLQASLLEDISWRDVRTKLEAATTAHKSQLMNAAPERQKRRFANHIS